MQIFSVRCQTKCGNLCIAGHNYVDNKFFSNLFKLKLDDEVKIYDLSGNFITYKIYFINEIKADDFSCTLQKLNNKKEVTLITCNNLSGNRLCIKAVQI